MFKKIATLVAIAAISASAIASEATARREAKEVVELKDGSTLYIFRDGKMAVEDQYGRAKNVRPNSELEAKDGQTFTMQGNEMGRLEQLLNEDKY